jgi:threonine synthase
MTMTYVSTRGDARRVTASEAILKGIADDGGLYAPSEIPKIGLPMERIAEMGYTELAFEVLKLYLSDYSDDELRYCVESAYGQGFDDAAIAPVTERGGVFFLELFHGRTLAFKDMALSILPYLLTTAKTKHSVKNEIVILTATSGDTGKAALAGFSGVDGTRIIVFYPKGGVSDVQRLQMVTQEGGNVAVVSIAGNFDDAQTGVKAIFADKHFNDILLKNGYVLSSANSINIGRLVPQIVYYFYAYGQLMKRGAVNGGEKVDFAIPTGNFGNILAGWYAKRMGLPIGELICASNSNNVLTDFFNGGVYDKNREFVLTVSPSMDILVSSNLERLLYELCGKDGEKIKQLYSALDEKGSFRFKTEGITAGFATEAETFAAIQQLHARTGYVMDTHTAVAFAVSAKIKPKNKAVIVSTASPYKFGADVLKAINGGDYAGCLPSVLFEQLSNVSNVPIPKVISGIETLPVKHTTHCDTKDMPVTVNRILGVK